jgi:hypothetical protein
VPGRQATPSGEFDRVQARTQFAGGVTPLDSPGVADQYRVAVADREVCQHLLAEIAAVPASSRRPSSSYNA